MHFVRSLRFAIAAVMLAVTTQASAAPTSYGTYYDELLVSNSSSCIGNCRVDFSQLPSNNLLMLSKVNCYISSQDPVESVFVTIAQTSGGAQFGRGVFVNPGPAAFVNNFYNYTFDTDARLLIGTSRFPYIYVNSGGGSISTMTCGIVGDLVTPIQ